MVLKFYSKMFLIYSFTDKNSFSYIYVLLFKNAFSPKPTDQIRNKYDQI